MNTHWTSVEIEGEEDAPEMATSFNHNRFMAVTENPLKERYWGFILVISLSVSLSLFTMFVQSLSLTLLLLMDT